MRIRSLYWLAPYTLVCASAVLGQTDLRSGYFTSSDGVDLHFLEAGSGAPILFVPGWTMPAEIWQPQLDRFAATHHVIAFDPRGQGRSEKVDYGYYATRRAQDIGELLDHLAVGPVVLVGWSLGVQEVLQYVHQSGTRRVAGAVLVDYAIDADLSQSTSLRDRYAAVQTDREEWMDEFVRAIFATPQSEEYLSSLTEAALSTPVNATAIMIGNLILMDTGDLTDAVSQLDKPALFVWIEGRPQSWRTAVEAAKPDAEIVVIPDAGHTVFVDQPELFNQALDGFLQRIGHR